LFAGSSSLDSGDKIPSFGGNSMESTMPSSTSTQATIMEEPSSVTESVLVEEDDVASVDMAENLARMIRETPV
jgi:hypothetical protein